jgi:hypothetical protein
MRLLLSRQPLQRLEHLIRNLFIISAQENSTVLDLPGYDLAGYGERSLFVLSQRTAGCAAGHSCGSSQSYPLKPAAMSEVQHRHIPLHQLDHGWSGDLSVSV